MNTRESLKGLQARLADRLKSARVSGVSLAWLAVTAGGANYLLPLRQSGEILPLARLQAVPRTQSWFVGVLNIRGSLYGAVDLGVFIASSRGVNDHTRPAANQLPDDHSSVVTINPQLNVNCALQVGGLSGLRSSESFRSALPEQMDTPEYFGSRFVDMEDKVWQELDLQAMTQSPQFLNISA